MPENVKAVIGRNVRLSRDAAGLSQEEFAERLKVSRQTLSSIETGKVAPDSTKLLEASQILGCPISDFFREEEEGVALLFRAAEHVKPDVQVRKRFQLLSRAYRELEEVIGVADLSLSPPEYSFYPETHSKYLAFANQVAISERERLGLGQQEPIENIFKLLEENGVRIIFEEIQQKDVSGVSGFSRKNGPCILVNSKDTLERNIFTVAHELGHLLMHRYLYQAGDHNGREKDWEIEKMAHEFAGVFLVPELGLRNAWLKNVGPRTVGLEDLVFLKHHFRVSAEVICKRIERLELAPEHQRTDLRSKIKMAETNPTREYRPLRLEDLEYSRKLNRFIHLQRKAAVEGMISMGRLAELLGKNIIEMRSLLQDWRRNLQLVPT